MFSFKKSIVSLKKMKKEFFKSNNSYEINVIGLKELPFDHSVTILNCKVLPELENDNDSVVNKNELNDKMNLGVKDNVGSDFETAMKAAKFGKFNWLILFAALWGYMSCMYTTTSMSLILPSAECDLNLSNFDKGILNSTVYIGMIISAFFWGCISDAVGRRNVLIVTYSLDSFLSIVVGLAQNFSVLLVAKLFTGFTSSAPIAILYSFLAENHSNNYRATVILCSGIFTSAATFTLPILALLIIPSQIRVVLFNGYITLPSWRIFLLVATIPSILAVFVLSFLEESPKFLMFQGNNEEALRVFKKIYNINTGKPKETFPVTCLRNEMGRDQNEIKGKNKSLRNILSTGWKQMVPMFRRPHIFIALLPCFIQFCTLFGVNTLRLWSPQLFSSAIDRERYTYNTTVSTICELLAPIDIVQPIEGNEKCAVPVVSDKVYFNSMITGAVTGIGYLISGYIVGKLEKKWLMIISYLFSIICCIVLYWSTSSDYLVADLSIFIAFTSTSATALTSAIVDIFPTSLRTTAVSLSLTFGRVGAMVGNMVFPLLLDWNCTAPFILLAVILFLAACLTFFLPKTKGKNLE